MGVAPTVAELATAVGEVRPVFQPVLWLEDLSITGYEALARGPVDSPLALPLDLFAAAKEHGSLTELEGAMTEATIAAVMGRPWHGSVTLFANLEPEAMLGPPPLGTLRCLEEAEAVGIRIVVEITERALLANPASLLTASTSIRSRGWRIAMDDVGADDETLTLLWVLQPEVVKLDMSILHRPFDARAAHVGATVREYCDRTGALMVCEGVETVEHESRARALGADLVQGFRYAIPGDRPERIDVADRAIELPVRAVTTPIPFAERVRAMPTDVLSGAQITAMAAELLSIATAQTDSALVLTSAPAFADVPPTFLAGLAEVATRSRLVALVTPGCDASPAPGVVGVDAHAGPDLGAPWSITVITPTMAASILSEPFTADGADGLVEHRLVHDRQAVAHAVRLLLAHIPTTP